MKIYKICLLLFCITAAFSSCETYGDADVDHSSVFPLAGEWVVQLKDVATGEIFNVPTVRDDRLNIYTYNTSKESTTQMWLRIGGVSVSSTSPYVSFAVKGIVDIDLANKTFNVKDATNDFYTDGKKFSISEGKVVLDGTTTASGGKADFISFKLTSDLHPNLTYEVFGYRRTGWAEDEPNPANTISLSQTTASLAVGEKVTIDIRRGNGQYTITSDDPTIATAVIDSEIDDDNVYPGKLTITAHKAGGTKVVLTDYEGRSENIVVAVQ